MRPPSANSPPPASASDPAASSGAAGSVSTGAAAEEMAYRSKLANLSNTTTSINNNGTFSATTKPAGSSTGGRSRGGRRSGGGNARRATYDPSAMAGAGGGGGAMRTPAAKKGSAAVAAASDGRAGRSSTSGTTNNNSLALATPSAAAAVGGRKSVSSRAETMSSYYGGGEAAQAVLRSAVKSHKKSARKSTTKWQPAAAVVAAAAAAGDDSFVTAVGDATVDHTFESQGQAPDDTTADLADLASMGDLLAAASGGNSGGANTTVNADTSQLNSTTASSSSEDDTLNRSAMSDPHDLTASSFLFVNKSRAMLRESTRELTEREAAAVQAQARAQQLDASSEDDDETGMGWEDKDDQGAFTEEFNSGLLAKVQKLQQQQEDTTSKVDGTVILDGETTTFFDVNTEAPPPAEAAATTMPAATSPGTTAQDIDDTREDWEMREDEHQHTLDINDALKLVKQQQEAHSKDDLTGTVSIGGGYGSSNNSSKLDGSMVVGTSAHGGRPSVGGGRSSISSMAAASPTVRGPNGVTIPSPSLMATPPIRSDSTPGASPASATSASSARRFAGSLRKTKHMANAEHHGNSASSRRASAPLPAAPLHSAGAGGDRRKSVAVLSAKGRASIGGGVPLAPVAASVARLDQVLNGTHADMDTDVPNASSKTTDDTTAHTGVIADLLEESETDQQTVATSSQKEQRRKSSISSGSVSALHPFTLDASMDSTAPPSVGGRRSSSASFAELERMVAEEEVASPSAASVRSIARSPSSLKSRRLSAKSATPPRRVPLHAGNDEDEAGDDANEEMEEKMPEESAQNDTPSSPPPAAVVLPFADSPARNTRTSCKRKSTSSPGVGSLGNLLPPGTPESTVKPSDKKRRSSTSATVKLPPRSPKLAVDSPARNTRSASKRKVASPAPADVDADDEQDGSMDVSDDTANTMDLKNIFDGVAVSSPPKQSANDTNGADGEEEVAAIGHAKRSSKRRKSRSSSGGDDDFTSSSSEMSSMGQGDTINLAEFVALSQELSQKDKSPEDQGEKVTFSAATPKTIDNNAGGLGAGDDADADEGETPPMLRSVSGRSATPGVTRAPESVLEADEAESPFQNAKENGKEDEEEDVIPTQDTNLVASPPPARPSLGTNAPVPRRSILNSSRKPRDSIASIGSRRQSGARRSVAFGSPEAAEYNVGSPSMSMTPMPSKQAKQRYVVPKSLNKDASNESETSIELGNDTADLNDINGVLDASRTKELEPNISAMLKEAEFEANDESIDGGADSPAASATVELPDNMHGLLADAEQNYQTELAGALSPADSSIASGIGENSEENTVELAGDVNALLAQNHGGGNETPVTSPSDSVEMTDAQSLASMNSRPRPSNSPPDEDGDASATQSFQSKKLLFDAKVGQAPPGLSSDDDEGDTNIYDDDRTQELDVDLRTLLENAGGKSPAAGSASTASGHGPNSRYSSNFAPRTNRMSFGSVATAEATQTIELEANMDALIEQVGPDDSDEIGGDEELNPETQELEGDMSALLAGVTNTSALSAGGEQLSSKRRKSRLSLVPQGRISLSTNGNEVFEVVSAEEDAPVVEAPSMEGESDTQAEAEVELEDVDVTFDELASSAQLLSGHHPDELDPGFNVLLGCMSVSANTRSTAMVDTVNQFLTAVCDSVEGNVEATRFDSAEMEHVIATKMDEMRVIQRGVRSVGPNSERTVELLQSLARSVEEFALADWLGWETQVAEALKQSVEPVSTDTETDVDQISAKVRLADDIHESMANMADRRVRKARRRSICRRKTAVSKMEDELRDIELQIEEAEAEFEEQQKAKEMLSLMSDALRAESSAKSEIQLQKKTAEESRGKINSVEKLHIWSPLCMEDSEISVSFNEFVKDPSMVVKFVNLQQRPIKCIPSLISEQENRIILKSVGSYKYSPSVAAFVKARMQRLVEEMAAKNGSTITVPGMKMTLQTLEWQIGRLELLAKEVQRMISQHEGVLYRNNGDNSFGIRFDMGGKLRVKILLSNSFAHGPINLTLDQIEDSVDVSRIRRQLVKNSKPGFGSLSRALDIIAAAVAAN